MVCRDSLEWLGWNARLEGLVSEGMRPARVVAEHRGGWELAGLGAEALLAEPSGRLRRAAAARADLPVVGDWVVVDDAGRIEAVLPRASLLVRKEAGRGSAVQPMVANAERAWIVTAPDGDFSPRRVERLLAVAWDGGALPEVVLGKIDLVADPAPYLAALAAVAPGVAVHAVGARDGLGVEALAASLRPGETVALLGSSGVGKSTLLNALAGAALQATAAVRARDQTGRHTTTGRRLVAVPGGGLLVDTPGMREVGLAGGDEGLGAAFADLDGLAAACRFRDCRHDGEPGCAVLAAIADGALAEERLESFRALAAEQARAAARRDARAAREARAGERQMARAVRAFTRTSPKRRG